MASEWPDMYIRVDAARAWQAFMQWCDGAAADWRHVVDEALAFEYAAGWEAGGLMMQGRCVAWQMVINFLNGTPEQWRKLMGRHVRNASALGYQNGYDNAMYRAHADGDGIEELVYQLISLTDRVEELEAALEAARGGNEQ